MGLSLGTGGVENERGCWCLPINQIFNYWIYDRKHVASILSSSFLAMSVAQRVPSQHSPINHLGDPIRFTLFPLLAICSSSCCRCIPSHSCFFFPLLAADSHSYLSLHPYMQPEAFCHQNVSGQEVNSVALQGLTPTSSPCANNCRETMNANMPCSELLIHC